MPTLHVCGLRLDDPFLRLLAQLMPVRFEAAADAPAEAGVRLQVANVDSEAARRYVGASLRMAAPGPQGTGPRGEVAFAAHAEVPFPFGGRRLPTNCPDGGAPLRLEAGESALASCGDDPIWSVAEADGRVHFRSAMPWPELAPDAAFFQAFNSLRFVESLPVVDFLRRVTGTDTPAPRPLRASFVIDDPNLHWIRYGFVDYAAVVAHARRVGYHMSFATIPLDTWYTNTRTASIFRDAPDRISLLVHGNNHRKGELARPYTPGECTGLLSEAIARMARFSQRNRLACSAVMVPPHGACSEEILSAMAALGYAAACVSSGSLAYHNAGRPWTRLLGFNAFERIGGCQVIPRWGLKNDVDNSVFLAAYLGQAIVVMGHHQDMADGLAEFDRVAGHINSLGPVAWSDMQTISELHDPRSSAAALGSADPSHRVAPSRNDPRFGSVPVIAGMRRIATEIRDRLTPMYSRMFTS